MRDEVDTDVDRIAHLETSVQRGKWRKTEIGLADAQIGDYCESVVLLNYGGGKPQITVRRSYPAR